jgi:lipopolysaccharide transport system permease protein
MFFIGLPGVGAGWVAASLHVYLRDTAQAVTVAMTLWFWMTPINSNPMSWIVRAYRERLLSTQWPS